MLFERKINGINFVVVAESWQTSNSWGHKVTLYKNGLQVASAKVRYYNRTWESYQYQSTIFAAVANLRNSIVNSLTDAFKTVNGYKVLTAGRRVELTKYLNSNKEYKTVQKLYKSF